ncbi:hypothetical protein [Teichococcus aestuarii]|uniref:hypothetical protein n=1 Tax=Teichococcus aestuarii TaxID=568898 RepID=UPI003616FCF1
MLAEDGAPLPQSPARVERFAAPPATPHPIGCACCQPRNPVAIALDRLFLARTRGEAPWFDAILAVVRTGEGEAAIRAALDSDSVAQARFRLEGRGNEFPRAPFFFLPVSRNARRGSPPAPCRATGRRS